MSLDRFLTAFETLAAQSVRFVDHVTATPTSKPAADPKPDTKAADPKPDTKAAETKKADPKPETKKADPKPETKKADPKPVDPAAPLTDDTVNENGFKYGTLKAAVISYGAEHGAPATMAILQDLGVSHAKHIEPALWEQAHVRFTAAPADEELFA